MKDKCTICGEEEMHCPKCNLCLNCLDQEHESEVTLLRDKITNLQVEKNKLIWEVKNLREGHGGKVV
jgi:hypothetical protein